jgi:hypothetical protein
MLFAKRQTAQKQTRASGVDFLPFRVSFRKRELGVICNEWEKIMH